MKHCVNAFALSFVAALGLGCGTDQTPPVVPPSQREPQPQPEPQPQFEPVAAPAPAQLDPQAGRDHTVPEAALPVGAPIPALPGNPPIEPIGEVTEGQIEVFPIMKTSTYGRSAIIDLEGPTLLVTDVSITSGQWTSTGQPNVYSSGFVTMKLAENQWTAVRAAKRLAVQPMPGTTVRPARTHH